MEIEQEKPELDTQTDQTLTTTQQIPPTQTQPEPRIDPAYVKLLEGTVADQNRRIAEAERRATEATREVDRKPVKTKDELRQEFYENPIEASRAVIREELEATIGPLKEFVAGVRGQTAIDQLVAKFKLDPRFKSSWSEGVEAYVRREAANIAPDRLNDTSFGWIVLAAVGMQTTGMIERPTTVDTPLKNESRNREDTVPTPTYMRPSPPASPTPRDDKPKHRELNENEKRLLREFNATHPRDKQMTEAQYLEWQTMPASQVATTKFDRPEPARK